MLKRCAIAALALLASDAALAQNVSVRPPASAGAQQTELMKLQAALIAAQQAAIKPGDELLPCEALDKELVSTMNSPVIQAYAAQASPVLAQQIAAQQQKKTPMAAQTAAAMAAALAPGAGMAGMPVMPQVAPGQTITPQQMQQAMAAQQQASIAYMNQLAPIMPALMRSQRITMLALAKNCTWAGGAGLDPDVGVPAAIPPGVPVPRTR